MRPVEAERIFLEVEHEVDGHLVVKREEDGVILPIPTAEQAETSLTPLDHILRQISLAHKQVGLRTFLPIENFYYPPRNGADYRDDPVLVATVTNVYLDPNARANILPDLPLFLT